MISIAKSVKPPYGHDTDIRGQNFYVRIMSVSKIRVKLLTSFVVYRKYVLIRTYADKRPCPYQFFRANNQLSLTKSSRTKHGVIRTSLHPLKGVFIPAFRRGINPFRGKRGFCSYKNGRNTFD